MHIDIGHCRHWTCCSEHSGAFLTLCTAPPTSCGEHKAIITVMGTEFAIVLLAEREEKG